MRRSSLLIACFVLAACAEGAAEGPWRPEPLPAGIDGEPMSLAEAEERYAALCASCHGELGEGRLGPPLVDHPDDVATLTQVIDQQMPVADPTQCEGRCADGIARFIDERLSQCLEIELVSTTELGIDLTTLGNQIGD